MTDPFDRAFGILVEREGGYANHAWDDGHETNFGISKRQYPDLDIRNLTLAMAKEIYRRDYWRKYWCDAMPWPLAMTMLDCVVNHAPANPIRWLQAAVGATPDGNLGPKTLAAVLACKDPARAAATMTKLRVKYVKGLADYKVAGDGWHNRHIDTLADAVRWDNNRPNGREDR